MSKLHLPAGSTTEGPWSLAVAPENAGWTYSGLKVLDLDAGQSVTFETGADEMLVLPLSGSATVDCAGHRFELAGRTGVFDGVTDFAYVPIDSTVTVTGSTKTKLSFPSARANRKLEPRYGPKSGVPVELRGAGQCSRQVNNFCTPESFDTDKLIACEVLTPAGNWSSYPPHKHDEDRPGEAVLEEIYYYEINGPGMAYQRVYGHEGKEIDILAEVRSGDVVLIPHGWHGPSMAVPGYDLYYLNVMAGPGDERAWLICDDPAHGWIRDTWAGQPIDPRLPMGAGK